jgi:hypothetical protein
MVNVVFFPVHAMRAHRGIRRVVNSFLTSVLDGGEWSTSRPGRFAATEVIQYTLNRRRGGSQSRSGPSGTGNNLLPKRRLS